ncbi:MAG: glycosyltransferase [Vicinamibacterales bacterium]
MVPQLLRPDAPFQHYVLSPRGCDLHYRNARAAAAPVLQVRAFAQYLRLRHRPSAVAHCYNQLASRKMLAWNRRLPCRNILMHERGAAWNVAPGSAVLKENARRARLTLCNSAATAALLAQQFGVPGQKLQVLFNAICDRDRLPPVAATSSAGREFRIGFLGRLEGHKGAHVALQAFAALPDAVKQRSRLLIYGEGTLRGLLQGRLGGPGVTFMGRTSDPQGAIAGLDLVVVPSIREPFGNVVAEAGLLGVPVIAANVDGIPEAAGSSDNVVLLDPTEPVDQQFVHGSATPLPALVYFPSSGGFSTPRQLAPHTLSAAMEDVILRHDEFRQKAVRHRRYVIDHMSTQAHVAALNRVYASLMSQG